jgi:tight adherence protein B
LKYTLLSVIFLLYFIISYIWFRDRTGLFTQVLDKYAHKLYKMLDAMFYSWRESRVRQAIVLCIIVFGLAGFFLPGKFSEMDKMASLNEALRLNKRENYDTALEILIKMIGTDSPLVYNELGVAYLGIKKYDDAAKILNKAVKIAPDYGKAYYNLAVAYAHQGKTRQAASALQKLKATEKFTITDENVYRLSGDIWQNITLRLILAFLMALLGYNIPEWSIKLMRWRRLKKYDDQLPDGLIMAANGLRAGLSLVQSFEVVSRESPVPISQEFGLILKEYRMGYDIDEALEHLPERMPTVDTGIFVNAVLILRETGGNLTEIFDTIAKTIQERKRVQNKIKTLTAEGETQAYMLAILPVVMAVVLNQLNPAIFSLLYTTYIGWAFIVLMAAMEGVGLYWMLKIVKVKI